MRALRAVVKFAFGLLLLFDLVIGFKLYANGWPKRVISTDVRPGVVSVKVIPIPFTGLDWWILAAFVGLHLLLIYFVWRLHARRLRAVTQCRRDL